MILHGQRLVIASHNQGKVREIGELIASLGITAISAAEAGIPEPEETGLTFAENAQLKAEHACQSCGLPALADDSGLVVPAIGGAPGIYSARWAGPNKDFSSAFKRIQAELGNKPHDAYFICTLALCTSSFGSTEGSPPIARDPAIASQDDNMHLFEGRIDGMLSFPPRGDRGFGYDPIFIPHGYAITFGEMTPDEKNRISHRARAFEKFLIWLNQR